ncbi:MAG: leishmanolysin, partial [Gammaproteobacteria bacterium]|nr:leishmanolysin [Gammaproteobacteria bacterium]
FTNRPLLNTWYPQALANSLAGTDLNLLGSDKSDMAASFNSDIDDSVCLGNTDWWYGVGGTTPPNAISFYETALHELAHGLGFLTFVNLSTGEKFMSRNDHFMRLLKDLDSGEIWPGMTSAERQASAVNTTDLVWIGEKAKAAAAGLLTAGLRGSGDIRMYAPNPLEPGSSVSHWDIALSPDELMEPLATPTSISSITTAAFEDMGWNIISGGPGDPGDTTPPNIVPFIFPLLLDE